MPTSSVAVATAQASAANGYMQADGFYSPKAPGVPIDPTTGGHSKGPANLLYGILPAISVYNTNAGTGAIALTTGNVTGAPVLVNLGLTGAQSGGVAATTPIATAWIAALPSNVAGQAYVLRVLNIGSTQTITFTGGTGVTVNGTATIANNTWRDFLITVATATTITAQDIGGGSIV